MNAVLGKAAPGVKPTDLEAWGATEWVPAGDGGFYLLQSKSNPAESEFAEVPDHTAEQDMAQAAFVRRCRDEFLAAVSVAVSAGLKVQVWGVPNLWSSDEGRHLDLEVTLVREL